MIDKTTQKNDLKKRILETSHSLADLADTANSTDHLERIRSLRKILSELDSLSEELKDVAYQSKVDIYIDEILVPKIKDRVSVIWDFMARNVVKIVVSLLLIGGIFSLYFLFQERTIKDNGLLANYYLDTELKKLFDRRLDKKIDFQWIFRSPWGEMSNRNFSIRWEGLVKTDQFGPHYFFTLSDDGVRLWIDDQLIINNWTVHGATSDNGVINLEPGFHKIEMEYFQGVGANRIRLSWQRPKDKLISVIPTEYLFPTYPEGTKEINSNFKLGVSMGELLRAAEKAEKERLEKEKLDKEKRKST